VEEKRLRNCSKRFGVKLDWYARAQGISYVTADNSISLDVKDGMSISRDIHVVK